MNSETGDGRKPPKKKARRDRFAFHQCWHFDAWSGLIELSDGEVGVYWRIILLMYMRRAALPLDRRWLANQCNIPLKVLNARLQALEEKGRIVVDTDQGLIYDERALGELVDAGFHSEAQTQRAKKRWADRPVLVVHNVAPIRPEVEAEVVQVARNYGSKSAPTMGSTQTQVEQNQEHERCRTDANQKPLTNTEPHPPRTAPPRRSPHESGGASSGQKKPAPKHGMSIDEWRADQLRRMGAIEEGKDETEREPDPPAPPTKPRTEKPKPAADRRCRRAG